MTNSNPTSVQEDLEDDKLALIDGDDEATDPQVDSPEILEQMLWITCCVTKKSRQKRKKADLIKSEGEGDWGTGIIDDQPREITTDWPREFRPLAPRVMSNESYKVEVTRTILTEDQPRPRPSSRPTSVRDLPINVQHSNCK